MNEKARPCKKKRLRRLILPLILVMILALAGWIALRSLQLRYTVTYDTYAATTGSISNALSFSGNFALVDSASYTADSKATVRKLYVAAGDDVKAGDKLARLSNGQNFTADFDGRVNTVGAAEGDEVAAGDEVVQIADFTHLKVAFRVDEYDIGDVAVGQGCVVTVTALERQFRSEVAAIDFISSSSGNVAYYTATTYVDVDDGVLPGMQVTVTMPKEEADNVVVLKVDAISFDETNRAYVWMKDEEEQLQRVYITTGVSNGNYIEIVEGVKDGDEVYAVARTTSTDSGMFSSMFSSQRFNQSGSGRGTGGYGSGGYGSGGYGSGWRGGSGSGSAPGGGSGGSGPGGGG